MSDLKSIVLAGATLSCSLGTTTSKLQVLKYHGCGINGKYQANIADYVGNKNILSFQSCTRAVPYPACSPNTCMKWIYGQSDFLLDGEPALLKSCIVPCLNGGIIKIIQNK